MDKVIDCKVLENKKIAKDTYSITFSGSGNWMIPGKFVDIKIKDKFLRRPMSVYKWNEKSFSCIYKIAGEGTKILAETKKGDVLNIFLDLGSGYTIENKIKSALIVSGGCGLGSVYAVAERLAKKNVELFIVAGFKTREEIFLVKQLKKLTKNVFVSTDDGSYGEKGNVIDTIKKHHLYNEYYYACGNTNLLKAVYAVCKKGQLSLEARMGCGYGVCMGCSIETTEGPKRICVEGPVFRSEVLKW